MWGFNTRGLQRVFGRTKQSNYLKCLKEAPTSLYSGRAGEDALSEDGSSAFSSLLGGVAWLCLTNAAIAVFVQALQRRGHAPRAQDLKKLNLVLRWCRRHPVGILFRKVQGKPRLVAVSDAAFKAIPDEASGLALRGCVIVLTSCSQTSPASDDGVCSVLEYVCRRQRRVVRSTFSGELNALIDSVELLLVVQMCLHQIWTATGSTLNRSKWRNSLMQALLSHPWKRLLMLAASLTVLRQATWAN